ncbi:MAG: D-alanyl-D-alanine carboxypeptidase, partial [Clostridia bacterium]|nr:D-alanyl-D-alanine carboxypeptidase [Clostridia bacterium]
MAVFSAPGDEVVVTVVEDEGALEVPAIAAKSAIVIDVNSGSIIYEKNAYEKRPMASTTKIMTALLALENGYLGDTVSITAEMLEYDEAGSTKLGLSIGDTITLHDLIVTMMLLSGNDAAQAVAVYLGGSLDGFASMMNERAAEIGMLDSHFITPSGLDDENHYSTAYDMALLGMTAANTPGFLDFTSM